MDSHPVIVVTASVVLGILTIITIIGNVFVIAAIILERNLRTTGNYLVLSLAVADLMVACLVMPLGAFSEIAQQWTLGTFLCDIWTSADVLCCTASILHLLAIALDRYWAVTYVDYIHKRTPKRICFMIFMVWTVAVILAIAPLVGWKDPDFHRRVVEEKRCLISQDIGYQIFATISTFYAPLIFILLLYWKIYQVARKRIRHKPGKTITPVSEANPKIIDLRNEKSLTGKTRRFFMPTKAIEKSNSINCGQFQECNNGQQLAQRYAAPVNSKARAIMGINNSSISLGEENNNGSGGGKNGANRHELANYLAVYPSETAAPFGHNGGNLGTCQSMVTLDASQLVSLAMARVENVEYEHNCSLTETPSGNSDTGVSEHHNSASGLMTAQGGPEKTNVNNKTDNNELADSTNYYHPRPCSSNSPSKQLVTGMQPPLSGPSSSTSSPAVTLQRPNRARPVHTITVGDSYHTTSSPASTSSNYHLQSRQNALKTKAIKESLESKRERKAAKILAIITGVFVICWTPFFVTALLMPLCEACTPSMFVFSIFQWFGYLNSGINPIIYTIFSPDFRNGFRRILCGRKR